MTSKNALRKQRHRLSATCTAACFAAAFSCGATYVTAANAQAQPVQPTVLTAQQWLVEPWSGNDRCFLQQTRTIGNLAGSLDRLTAAVSQRRQSFTKRRDALSLYGWGYAAYTAAKQARRADREQFSEIVRAMEQVPSPKSYSFTRLRFLISASLMPLPYLRGVGERLLTRKANDTDVKYCLINVYYLGNSGEREKALRYVADLIAVAPQRPSFRACAGSTYFRLWLLSKKHSDAEQALAHYHKYLELAPHDDPFRPRAEEVIRILERRS